MDRFKAYNDANKDRRKALRNVDAELCIRRTNTLWRAGGFDAETIALVLPRKGRIAGLRTRGGTRVRLYDGPSGEMVEASYVRSVNLRARGYFVLARREDGTYVCGPHWTCFIVI